MVTIRKVQDSDICLWPDGTWCYNSEVHEFTTMSDDYEIVSDQDPRYGSIEGNCKSCQGTRCTAGPRCVTMGQS